MNMRHEPQNYGGGVKQYTFETRHSRRVDKVNWWAFAP